MKSFWLEFEGCDASWSICAVKIASNNVLFESALAVAIVFKNESCSYLEASRGELMWSSCLPLKSFYSDEFWDANAYVTKTKLFGNMWGWGCESSLPWSRFRPC